MRKVKDGYRWMLVTNNGDVWSKRIVIDIVKNGCISVATIDEDNYFENLMYTTHTYSKYKECEKLSRLEPIPGKDLWILVGRTIRNKYSGHYLLVIRATDKCIFANGEWIGDKELLDDYIYQNGSPVCAKEKGQ